MNPTGLIFFAVILLIDSLIKAQRRSQGRGSDWQEIFKPRNVRSRPGMRPGLDPRRGALGKPEQSKSTSGRPVRRTPIREATPVDSGLEPAPEYGGSMDFFSTEGTSHEWGADDAVEAEAAELTIEGSEEASAAARYGAPGAAVSVAVAMLTGRSDTGGPSAAIVLGEVLDRPRAHRPWRPRGKR